jgi:uncharacterized damage-inducible protein DinB
MLRDQLSRLLEVSEAHTDFDDAVAAVSPDARGIRPAGLPHSPWELLEHIRLAQRDILEFCQDAPYADRAWPADYWPPSPEPPTPQAWDASIEAVRRDRAEFQRLIQDPGVDLFAVVPNGSTQTYLREVLLTADHNAYHLGQLMVVRQLL